MREPTSFNERIVLSEDNHMTKLTFSVQATLPKQEHLRIVGDIPELGRWSPFNCIELKPSCEQSACKTWSVEIDVPAANNTKYCYRYLVCQNLKGKNSNVPTIIKCGPLKEGQGFSNHVNDGLLQIDDLAWIDGWLLHDTEVYLTIHNANGFPIGLLHDYNASPSGGYRVKISPVSLENKNQGCLSGESFSDTVLKVAGEYYSSVCNQEEMGVSYDPSKHYSFVTRVLDLERVIFKVEVFTASEEHEWKVLGCGFIQPINLKGSHGVLDVCICNNDAPIGFVQVEYLLIKPLVEKSHHNMGDWCDRNWQKQTRTLEMGHRGCGMTFSTSSDGVQENTMESFITAYEKGADGLELDVHVTKDLELVVYHDLHVKAVLQTMNASKLSRMVPVHHLTYEELQQIQAEFTNSSEMNDKLHRCDDPNCKTFVTLNEVLLSLPADFPMELEVKYIESEKDKEDDPFMDVNFYVDCILDTLLKNIGSRKVILMSFSTVIVQLISRKQKKVPVKIGVCGETDKYPVYNDIRIRTVRMAVEFAHCERILGVSLFCDHVLADPGIVDEMKKRNLILSTWGEANNTQSGRQKQREMGVNVLCYDRIHEAKNE